jgi:hypothetical protein
VTLPVHRGITVADERQSLPISDCKTRGFNLEDSQIERTDRLDRLVLVLSLALYWAVSAGMWDAMKNMTPAEKNTRRRNARTLRAA